MNGAADSAAIEELMGTLWDYTWGSAEGVKGGSVGNEVHGM